jgi:hypothetical protein
MNVIEKYRQERLKRTEVSLRLSGAEKCGGCNIWMDKEYLKENNSCNECNNKGV